MQHLHRANQQHDGRQFWKDKDCHVQNIQSRAA